MASLDEFEDWWVQRVGVMMAADQKEAARRAWLAAYGRGPDERPLRSLTVVDLAGYLNDEGSGHSHPLLVAYTDPRTGARKLLVESRLHSREFDAPAVDAALTLYKTILEEMGLLEPQSSE